MTGGTALITGATGLLGSHLTDLLLRVGQRPRVFVLPGQSIPWNGVDVHRGDLRDRTAVAAAVRGVEVVFHCAAVTGVAAPRDSYHQINVVALGELVDAAQKAGVRHVVHVSSITVHGNDIRGWADEGAPFCPAPNPYSRSKVAGERLLSRLVKEHGAPVTVVRPGWIYGPRDTASFARLAALVSARRMVTIGRGGNHLPLVYASDVAQGLILAAAKPPRGCTYLLVNEELITQSDFLAAIANELGAAQPRLRVPYKLALCAGTAGDVMARVSRARAPVTRYGVELLGGENRYSSARARTDLGFEPRVGMREGVQRTVAWLRSSALAQPHPGAS